MPLVQVETIIKADLQTCFDLARDIDFYKNSLKNSSEIPIGGKTTGLVELNDIVVWESNLLGIVRHINLKVTEFDSPRLFVDEMVTGNFKEYKHEHLFRKSDNETIMIDKFYFESSFGILGKLFDWIILEKYMYKALIRRNNVLKDRAESMQLEKVS